MKVEFNQDLLVQKLKLSSHNISGNLLQQAVTHKSVLLDKDTRHLAFNERLEFLGDAILKASVSAWLFQQFPNFSEGKMTRIRSYVVSDAALAKMAFKIGIQEHLILGKSEKASGGYTRESILASAFEAICGAIFMSTDYTTAAIMIIELLKEELEEALQGHSKDFKGLLQEYSQDKFKCRPDYVLVDSDGPSHQRLFKVQVMLKGEVLGEGTGLSKKKAEQESAHQALKKLNLLPKGNK